MAAGVTGVKKLTRYRHQVTVRIQATAEQIRARLPASVASFAAWSPRSPTGSRPRPARANSPARPEWVAADETQQSGLGIYAGGYLDPGAVLAGGAEDLLHLLHPAEERAAGRMAWQTLEAWR
jgi:hypothetical protein